MNKGLFVGISLVIILTTGVGVFLFFSNKNRVPQNTSTFTQEEAEKTQTNEAEGLAAGDRYVEYSEGVLDENQNIRRVLFFYASWCPTCRPADANFKQNVGKIPEDVSLIRVNYNDPQTDDFEKALAQKYNVTYQHTFVHIDSNGNELTKWNGGQIDELLENLK